MYKKQYKYNKNKSAGNALSGLQSGAATLVWLSGVTAGYIKEIGNILFIGILLLSSHQGAKAKRELYG
jgi:hypothetical protein